MSSACPKRLEIIRAKINPNSVVHSVSEALLNNPGVMAALSPEEREAKKTVAATSYQQSPIDRLLMENKLSLQGSSMGPEEKSATAKVSLSDSTERVEELISEIDPVASTKRVEDMMTEMDRSGQGEHNDQGDTEPDDDDPMKIRFGGKKQTLSTVREAAIFANEARCVSMRTMSAALKMLETQAEEIDSVKEELGKIKRRSLLSTAASDGKAKGLVADFPTLSNPTRMQRVKGESDVVTEGVQPLEGDGRNMSEEINTYPNKPRLFKQFGWTMHMAD